MPEQLDLTTPIVPASTTFYKVQRLALQWDMQTIVIVLTASDGSTPTVQYAGAEAVALMTVLNSANLSVKSLQRRILEKLVADGKLPAGAVSGVAS